MSVFNKFLLIFCFGFMAIGLFGCPQQQPAGDVEEKAAEEVQATPAP